ncbi:MAG: hypothetical protein ACR2QO_13010 [Acidimicrobiales bacterium]
MAKLLQTRRGVIGVLVLAFPTFLVACGGGDSWQEVYRAKLDDDAKETTAEELALSCVSLENMSDEELYEFAVTVALAEDASDIDSLLEREGVEPTAEIYDEAAGIFIDSFKSLCEQ